MSRKRPLKKRTADDFLAMLSEIVVQDNKEESKDSEVSSQKNSFDDGVDLTKDYSPLEIQGTPILFNDWFNVIDKKFNLDKPELKMYRNDFGLALSTKSSIPTGPIELQKQLSNVPANAETLKNDILAPSIFDYRDFLYVGNENSRFRKISALHVVNHIYRDFEAKENKEFASLKDSNFTPTVVLVICPHKMQALKFIKKIIKCLPDKVLVKKSKAKTQEGENEAQTKEGELKTEEGDDEEYVEQLFQVENYDKLMEYSVEKIPEHIRRTRPADWLETFGGNTESDFKTGIRFFSDKVSLFQEISKSQLVVASPLALSLFEEKNFMSSIEVLVLDSIDVLVMQHPDRLAQIMVSLNNMPKTLGTTDWSRLRQYCIDKNNKKMRQSIGYGRILSPEIMNLYNKTFENIRGELIVRPIKYPQVLKPIDGGERVFYKMLFSKSLTSSTAVNSNIELIGDVVFKTFNDKIFPLIKQWRNESEDVAKRTIIYFVSTFRFLQARKMLDDDFINFLELSDESTQKDSSNMKSAFKKDKNAVLLLTERHYFYFRPKLEPERIVFLQPPSYPMFAQELAANCSSTVYFTEYDELALERVVGSDHLQKILSSDLYSY